VDPEVEATFQTLKEALCTAPYSCLPTAKKEVHWHRRK
jgi:hypothetical protein